MNVYKIYANPQGTSEAVKQGWSWPGFFFNLIWACVKRMWFLGIGWFALFFVLGLFEGGLEKTEGEDAAMAMAAFTTALGLIVAIVFGINGNRWRERNLKERGYEYQDTDSASNPEAAVALWMKENQSN